MRRSHRLFLLLSVVILLFDAAFVLLNRQAARRALDEALAEQGQQSVKTFNTALTLTYDTMLQMATFVAHDPEVGRLFRAGASAVAREGGGAGGPAAAALRQQLFDRVHSSWAELTSAFGFRQLHFHLPPGSTSFLRVHKPDRFGDTMHDVRHTVVAVNARQKPVTGFETGRVYSGLRGVAPVFATAPDGSPVFVGALEAGTSFSQIIGHLRQEVGSDIAVLLRAEHVGATMWPDAVKTYFTHRQPACDCYLEATTAEEAALALLPLVSGRLRAAQSGTELIEDGPAGPVAVTFRPLTDFLGDDGRRSGPVGSIMLWRDVTAEVGAFHRDQRNALALAIGAFIAIEVLLFVAVRVLARRLEDEVDRRTGEVQALNAELHRQATTDALTGLANRRSFLDRLEMEAARADRTGQPLTIALIDADHFKRVNDTRGHAVGDVALAVIADCLAAGHRVSDLPARYGGEEFTLLLPDTDVAGARTVLTAVRARLAATAVPDPVGGPFHVTVSVGLAQLAPGEDVRALLRRADEALYAAKAAGRDRISEAAPAPQAAAAGTVPA